jgi:NAD(P)H-dependent FMN reductase
MPRTTPNPHCQAAAMHAAAALAGEPMPSAYLPCYQPHLPVVQQAQSWDSTSWQAWHGMQMLQQPQQLPQQHMDHATPHISQMLIREAEAWKALLQLHGSVLNLTKNLAGITANEVENPHLRFDEPREASDQRETAYIAAISQVCAQCDLLVAEAIKIRGLRKAKHQAETQALKEILRTHADETLGMGEIIARNSAIQVASVTSELRQAAQAMRTQVQQARALLAATSEWRAAVPANAPPGLELVMGYRRTGTAGEGTAGEGTAGEGTAEAVVQVRPVAQVLEHVYQRGQLTDENLVTALVEGPLAEPETVPAQQRTFSRRRRTETSAEAADSLTGV